MIYPPLQPNDILSCSETGEAAAIFDASEQYRYYLLRTWDPTLPTCLFLMLNPSTADAFKLDPTCTRALNFAKNWGFGSLVVVNAFALRSTDPKALYESLDPVGVNTDYYISQGLSLASKVIVAWGTHIKKFPRESSLKSLLKSSPIPPECLALTKEGYPKHPLYVSRSVQPFPYTQAID